MEFHGKNQNHQQAEPERRDRPASYHQGGNRVIQRGIPLDRRENPKEDRQRDGHKHGDKAQLQRCRKPLLQQLDYRPVKVVGISKVTPEDIGEILDILLPYWLVQAQHAPDIFQILVGAFGRNHHFRRIAYHAEDDKYQRHH